MGPWGTLGNPHPGAGQGMSSPLWIQREGASCYVREPEPCTQFCPQGALVGGSQTVHVTGLPVWTTAYALTSAGVPPTVFLLLVPLLLLLFLIMLKKTYNITFAILIIFKYTVLQCKVPLRCATHFQNLLTFPTETLSPFFSPSTYHPFCLDGSDFSRDLLSIESYTSHDWLLSLSIMASRPVHPQGCSLWLHVVITVILMSFLPCPTGKLGAHFRPHVGALCVLGPLGHCPALRVRRKGDPSVLLPGSPRALKMPNCIVSNCIVIDAFFSASKI